MGSGVRLTDNSLGYAQRACEVISLSWEVILHREVLPEPHHCPLIRRAREASLKSREAVLKCLPG